MTLSETGISHHTANSYKNTLPPQRPVEALPMCFVVLRMPLCAQVV
jgi:hypothetical protein